jgi:putative transposase
MEVVAELAVEVPVSRVCASLGVARSAWYRARHTALGALDAPGAAPTAIAASRPRPPNALSDAERVRLREVLNSERFADRAVPQVHAQLLAEGMYLASVSTMYRVLRAHGEVRDRRDQRQHPPRSAPVLSVRAPNEVWSWDITRLPGLTKGVGFFLYVLLDVFSRFVVGWLVAQRQSADLAGTLITEALRRHGLLAGPERGLPAHALALLSDNGGPMTAKPLAVLMDDLGVRQVFARPHTPNDNAFSEAQFKTMKYRPTYPNGFANVLDARGWCQSFFDWYNHQHFHSGIGMLTPAAVFEGRADHELDVRRRALAQAFDAHPERFRYRLPVLAGPPQEVWINRPINHPGLIQPAELLKL